MGTGYCYVYEILNEKVTQNTFSKLELVNAGYILSIVFFRRKNIKTLWLTALATLSMVVFADGQPLFPYKSIRNFISCNYSSVTISKTIIYLWENEV